MPHFHISRRQTQPAGRIRGRQIEQPSGACRWSSSRRWTVASARHWPRVPIALVSAQPETSLVSKVKCRAPLNGAGTPSRDTCAHSSSAPHRRAADADLDGARGSLGKAAPGGIRLALPASHEQLATLIGTRRHAVSTALGQLRSTGQLSNLADGDWLLSAERDARVSPPAPAHLTVAPRAGGQMSLLALDRGVCARILHGERAPTSSCESQRCACNAGAGLGRPYGSPGSVLLVIEGFLPRETRYQGHAPSAPTSRSRQTGRAGSALAAQR